jgi:hypothetical protein
MPEDDKTKRPKFSAPKPPVDKSAVVTNADDHPVTDTVVVKDNPQATATVPVDTGSPTPKVVSRTNTSPDNSDLNTILAEKNSTKITPPRQSSTSVVPPKAKEGSSCNAILVGITAFSLIIGLAGWALYFTSSSSVNIFSKPSSGVSPTPAVSGAPQVTPTPATVTSTTTLEILNGSGVSGAAGKTATSLEKLGYKITKTGNASNSNYKLSVVYVNPNFTDTDKLLQDLKTTFGSATISGTLKDSTASAQIIVGTDWTE